MNMNDIRKQFPILRQKINNNPLVYLDNTATTQKPLCVLESMNHYYTSFNSNIHRGVHYLSQQATQAFEEARNNISKHMGARHSHEVIFTKGCTESINLAAQCLGKTFIHEGDEILISTAEHHANIVPWQVVCQERKAQLKIIPIDEKGEISLLTLEKLISNKTKILAITHISNVLGNINPIQEIIEIAHKKNALVLIDGAQSISHLKINVSELDCDFFCFSSHKMYGPMGIGILYGKEKYLNQMPPYQLGGEMIKEVRFEETTYNELPFKFEAGTPAVAEAIGLSKAFDFIDRIDIKKIAAHEDNLLKHATRELLKLGDVTLYGSSENKAAVLSFNLKNIHPFDAGVILDHSGVAVRTGHHCAQPLMQHYGIQGSIRAGFAVYNTLEEVDLFIESLKRAKTMLS